jgi:hypothetical protein
MHAKQFFFPPKISASRLAFIPLNLSKCFIDVGWREWIWEGGREGGMSPKIIHQSRWNQERRRQAPTFITGHHHPTINNKQSDALTRVDITINVLIIVCLTNSDDAFVGTLMFQRLDKVFLCTIRFYASVAFSYYFSDICVMTLPTTRNLNV